MSDIVGRGWTFPVQLNNQGKIGLTTGHDEISQSIHIILSTRPGERVMRPTFGCRIQELIFAPNDIVTSSTAERYVREALGRWEPRINVTNVVATPDENQNGMLVIQVDYEIKETHDVRSLVFPFYLLPDEG